MSHEVRRSDVAGVRTGLRMRQAARGLVITPEGAVVLVRFEFPKGTRWALPGGGLENGETHVEALRRELVEELGLGRDRPALIGVHLWTRRHVVPFPDGAWDGQEEHIHLVEVDAPFTPEPMLGWDRLRDEYVHEIRWWTLDELAAARADTGITFVPGDLVALVEALRRDGPPPTAVAIDP